MFIEVVSEPGRLVLHIRGELDIATGGVLRRALLDGTASNAVIALDLSAVTFVDCAGLQSLVWAVGSARRRGHVVSMTGSSPSVRRLVSVLGLGRSLTQDAAKPNRPRLRMVCASS